MLVPTKLGVPQPHAGWLPRPRLIAALDAGLPGALTLISAPPGYGKSSLAASWLSAKAAGNRLRADAAEPQPAPRGPQPMSLAWLSLDEEDRDPQLFFGYLAAALPAGDSAPGQLAAMLQSPRAQPARALMKAFMADVSALAGRMVLVLDDFHAVDSPAISAALAMLLDHPPPALHLVILTRSDPSLPIARLRARGALSELRADELRFSADEAAALLTGRLGLPLTPAQVLALEQRTEGWAAGLQLAALAMRARGDLDSFVAHFTGSHRFIMDYLSDEVLGRLAAPVQSFLVQTSALTRLCAPLCDAAIDDVGRPAASILAELEAGNSFLVPLDDGRTWYRYHHLFAALLRQQLPPEQAASIRRRAARWSAARGQIDAAVGYAIAGEDHAYAAELLVAHGLEILFQGKPATLQRWLDALPAALRAGHARLCTLYAWALLNQGRADEVEPHLLAAERAAPGVPAIRAVTALIRSNLARAREDLEVARAEAQIARDLARPEDIMIQGVAGFQLGAVRLLRGDAAGAVAPLGAALALARQSQNLNVTLLAGGHLGLAQLISGQAEAAAETLRAVLADAAARGAPHSPLLAFAQIGLGHLALARADVESAWAAAARALAACHEIQELGGLRLSFLLLAAVDQAAGRAEAAARALERARQIDAPDASAPLAAQLMRLHAAGAPRPEPSPAAASLAEPLSERERAILALIAAGRTNQEIADQLVISLNTVLYHTKNIYGKLGVNRRTGAVARARALGLLE